MKAIRKYFEAKLESIVAKHLAEILREWEVKVTVLFQPKKEKPNDGP